MSIVKVSENINSKKMKFEFRTIKAKMIFAFTVFFMIGALITATNLWFNTKKERIAHIISTLTTVDRKVQLIIKLEKNFFTDETVNSQFYATGNSDYLRRRRELSEQVNDQIRLLRKLESQENFGIDEQLDSLTKRLLEYNTIFYQLVDTVKKRGFRDYGLEGEMRRYIHAIEDSADNHPIDRVLLLTIRRHEKDYILRKDTNYLHKLLQITELFKWDIREKIPNPEARNGYLKLVDDYAHTFAQLVHIEKIIGTDHRKKGMKKDLVDVASKVEIKINEIDDIVFTKSVHIRQNIQITLMIIISIGVVFNILIALYATRILSNPVSDLSNSIHAVIASDFSKNIDLQTFNTKDEIGRLAGDFTFMLQKVQSNISEIREKSEKIEQKQKLLLDSLRYAQRIQHAILPDDNDLLKHFSEYFVIYRPQHFVSGDFYWFVEKYNKKFLAVVDCTGHGVPGAFMSMIGHTLLTKIITQDKIFNPAEILENLHREVKEALHQEENKNDDGMDVCLCVVENIPDQIQNVRIVYAGAKSSLFYSQDNAIQQVKGTNRSIGGRSKHAQKDFVSTELILFRDEMIYLCTDGMIDQNDTSNRKYGKTRFFHLLHKISRYDTPTQRQLLEKELDTFMTNQVQRDDITIMGVRL